MIFRALQARHGKKMESQGCTGKTAFGFAKKEMLRENPTLFVLNSLKGQIVVGKENIKIF